MFSSVERCNTCPAVSDEAAAKKVDRERELWQAEDTQNLSDASFGRVFRKLMLEPEASNGL